MAGSTTETINGKSIILPDICLKDNLQTGSVASGFISEFYCTDNKMGVSFFDCGADGCSNGKCNIGPNTLQNTNIQLSCISDDGKIADPFKKGVTNILLNANAMSVEDTCVKDDGLQSLIRKESESVRKKLDDNEKSDLKKYTSSSARKQIKAFYSEQRRSLQEIVDRELAKYTIATKFYCTSNGGLGFVNYNCEYACQNGACILPENIKYTTILTSGCIDDEDNVGGVPDLFTRGTILFKEDGAIKFSTDTCIANNEPADRSDGTIAEFSCSGGEKKLELAECVFGCENGGCLKPVECSEKYEDKKITVTFSNGNTGEFKDFCTDDEITMHPAKGSGIGSKSSSTTGKYLVEYFCNNEFPDRGTTECKCKNGACITSSAATSYGGKKWFG